MGRYRNSKVGVSRGALPQRLKAGHFWRHTAGLRPSKPKTGLPGTPKGLLHPHRDTATLDRNSKVGVSRGALPQRLKPVIFSGIPQASAPASQKRACRGPLKACSTLTGIQQLWSALVSTLAGFTVNTDHQGVYNSNVIGHMYKICLLTKSGKICDI